MSPTFFGVLFSTAQGTACFTLGHHYTHPYVLILVVSYTIQTHTSTDPGADTDADVYVTLFGDRGDTGRRLLMHSDNEDMFQEGQVRPLLL